MDFEDLEIRKNYIDKLNGKDVSHKLLKFKGNIKITSDMMFNKFISTFERSGYSSDDVLSLSTLYAHYYFDIYAEEKENERDERNGLITFIRQRVYYLAKICERKSNDFHVSKNLSGFYAKTEKSRDLPDDVIILNPVEFGYRKLGEKEFRSVKNNNKGNKVWKDENGFDVLKLEFYDCLYENEYKTILYEDSDNFKNPEDKVLELQEKDKVESDIINFEQKTMVDKIRYLNTIATIDKNNRKRQSAEKLLKILKKQIRNERNNPQLQGSNL